MKYSGETTCEGVYKNGNKCASKAYYSEEKKHLCGRHSKRESRSALEKNPLAAANRIKELKQRKAVIKQHKKKNKENGVPGKIICTKLRMMQMPEWEKGYMMVFPNYKHENRIDGYGCKSLSPKSIGPIDHKMKDLPIAQNLENYHQFSKVYSFELDEKNNVVKKSLDYRIKWYKSDVPMRHKYPTKLIKKYGNSCEFALYYDLVENKERRYTYIQCRYFYCHWYELLTKDNDDLARLKKRRNRGYNLQIVGYDSFDPEIGEGDDDSAISKKLYKHYLDGSRPFGHELVLYTILMLKNPKQYPWNVYRKKHKKLYKNMFK